MTPTSGLVRAPQAGDEPAWRQLWAAYLAFYETKIEPEATEFTLRRIMEPGNAMFGRVAERDGAAVGFATLRGARRHLELETDLLPRRPVY